MTTNNTTQSNVESSVYNRYQEAAQKREEALCCPVTYAGNYLKVIPEEILERDYGCGDPSAYVNEGETIVDLGSGGGKLCYIMAQAVGEKGTIIGVDCNQEMLGLAKKYQQQVAEKIGYSNVDFRYGLIQDLQLDLNLLGKELEQNPVNSPDGFLQLRQIEDRLREEQPLIESDSVDCVVSNCVLNLVRQQDRLQLFNEIFRVLKDGGRAVISDIVSDEDVPEHLQRDGELWSGCISGAFREDEFLKAFEDAGFHGIEIVKRQAEPWQVVEGIEFRSMTVIAYKGKEGPCLERNQAIVYKGPFRTVEDDDGHVYFRGERMAVCEKTFHLLQNAPYENLFEPIEPANEIPTQDATAIDCTEPKFRNPQETKGAGYQSVNLPQSDCCGDTGCC